MRDARAIWAALRAEGRVQDDPPSEEHAVTPWSARVLSGVAAWIATPLLLGFIAVLLGQSLFEDSATVVIGLVMCLAVSPLLQDTSADFVEQGATVVSLAGLALFGFGLSEGMELDRVGVAAGLTVLSGVVFMLSRVDMHRFLCALVLIAASMWLLYGTTSERMTFLQQLLPWLAVALWWLDWRTDPANRWHERLPPLAWAATLIAIVLAWFNPGDLYDHVDPVLMTWAGYAGAALLPVTALAVGRVSRVTEDRRLAGLLLVATILLAWLWRWSPGITLSLSLMLIAYARGTRVLLTVASAALLVYLVAYYYQLAVPLLDKALWLGIAGVVLMVIYVIVHRWPEHVE